MKKHLFFLFAFLLLNCQIGFAELLLNKPIMDGKLQILAEGAGNSTAFVVKPNGARADVALVEGYAEVDTDMAGKWLVRIGNEEKTIVVKQNFGNADNDAGKMDIAGAAIFAVLFACFAGAAAGGAWYFFIRKPEMPERAMFAKKLIGKMVKICLSAGNDPLEDVKITYAECNDGKQIAAKKKRLCVHEKIEIEYECACGGKCMRQACAEFLIGGKRVRIDGEEGGAEDGKEMLHKNVPAMKQMEEKKRLRRA